MPLQENLPLSARHRQWPVWGTVARMAVTVPALAEPAQELVSAYLDRVGRACSRFQPGSELATVQALTAAQPADQPRVAVPISELLADLLDAALDAARRTGGDVDPTLADDLAALGYDQDFAHLRAGTIPVRLIHRKRHDWREIELTRSPLPQVSIPAGVRLDLGASAKAFAADQAAALVATTLGCGVLVALGGDVAVAGHPPAGGWQILVQDGEQEPAGVVSLFSGGLATSSTLSRRWQYGTRRVHHILDPRTGDPADPVWVTVSVVAGSCAEANMLSTASIVRGWPARTMLSDAGHPARLVTRDREVLRSGGWPPDREQAA